MLEDIIEKLLVTFEGEFGLAVKNLRTGYSVSQNGDEIFPSASVRKIPIALELYRQTEKGKINLDDKVKITEKNKGLGSGILKELSPGIKLTYRDLASLMIMISDNTAADIILKKVGKENVNSTLQELGLIKTKLVANSKKILFDLIGLEDIPEEEKTFKTFIKKSKNAKIQGTWSIGIENNNITTPNEMLNLIEIIMKNKILVPNYGNEIIDIMSRCQTGNYMISKYLPREKVIVADKTGSLPGIRNDVGLIKFLDKDENYILSCFTRRVPDIYRAEEVIAEISKNVFKFFT